VGEGDSVHQAELHVALGQVHTLVEVLLPGLAIRGHQDAIGADTVRRLVDLARGVQREAKDTQRQWDCHWRDPVLAGAAAEVHRDGAGVVTRRHARIDEDVDPEEQ
jgi:hypothetical protein